MTGDFFQLPPVAKSSAVKFAFEAEYWKQTVKKTFNLTKVFRQKDPGMIDAAVMILSLMTLMLPYVQNLSTCSMKCDLAGLRAHRLLNSGACRDR